MDSAIQRGAPTAVGGRWTEAAAYAAVFFVMMSNLMLELLLTRVFSATMWYHFAFMAVSTAMFGTTVGAVLVHLRPPPPAHSARFAAGAALAYAVATVGCMVLLLRVRVTFGTSWAELGTLGLVQVLAAVPFVLSGIFICAVLLGAGDRVGVMYGADLLGAALGCALFVPFMAHGDGPRAVLPLAALAAAGAALLAWSRRQRTLAAAAVVVAGLCLLAFAARLDRQALQVHWARGDWARDAELQRWNAFSRLTVDQWLLSAPSGWGFGARFQRPAHPADEKRLVIDSMAATTITRFNGDWQTVAHLGWDVTSLAYALRPTGSALIIGVGGGRDLLTALSFGATRVVGVEVNPDVVALLRGPFAEYTGRLAFDPRVQVINDEARSYVARSRERFDVIQASLVDTWAAAASGAYVLSENALYTREAFGLFLDHLAPGGVLSFSRWHFGPQPAETLRLVALAADALRRRGVARPADHLYLGRGGPTDPGVATLLVAAQPFTPTDLGILRRTAQERGFDELLGGGRAATEALATLTEATTPTLFLERFPLDLSPPTDDRPFFFNMRRLRDLASGRATIDPVTATSDPIATLAWLLGIVALLSAVCILGPLWWRREPTRSARMASRLTYFGAIGLGFILIELALMQRLMIVLGHPVYGLAVVLFALLGAAGAGSIATRLWLRSTSNARLLRRALVALVLTAAATGALGPLAAPVLERAETWVRIIGCILLLVPLGVLLGVPLAAGLTLSAEDSDSDRALYWGVNGAASVCGSVVAVMLGLTAGITATFAAGVLLYAAAAAVPAFKAPADAE